MRAQRREQLGGGNGFEKPGPWRAFDGSTFAGGFNPRDTSRATVRPAIDLPVVNRCSDGVTVMQMNFGEQQRPDGEDAIIKDLAALQLAIIQKTGPNRRGQHPKHHGCVMAEFAVRADIPEQYLVGLFKEPKVYHELIRTSNGAAPDDNTPNCLATSSRVAAESGADNGPIRGVEGGRALSECRTMIRSILCEVELRLLQNLCVVGLL